MPSTASTDSTRYAPSATTHTYSQHICQVQHTPSTTIHTNVATHMTSAAKHWQHQVQNKHHKIPSIDRSRGVIVTNNLQWHPTLHSPLALCVYCGAWSTPGAVYGVTGHIYILHMCACDKVNVHIANWLVLKYGELYWVPNQRVCYSLT